MRRILAAFLLFFVGVTKAFSATLLPQVYVNEIPDANGGSYFLGINQPAGETWYVNGWGITNEDATDVFTGLTGWSAWLMDASTWDSGNLLETYVPCCGDPLPVFETGAGGIGIFEEVFGPGYSQAAVYWVDNYTGDPGLSASSQNFNWLEGAGNSTAFAIISNFGSGEKFACDISVNSTTGVSNCAPVNAPVVPLPAAAWLFASAIAGLGLVRRRQTAVR